MFESLEDLSNLLAYGSYEIISRIRIKYVLLNKRKKLMKDTDDLLEICGTDELPYSSDTMDDQLVDDLSIRTEPEYYSADSKYYDEDGLEPEPEFYSAEEQVGGGKVLDIELRSYLIGQNEFYNKKHIIKKKKKKKKKKTKNKKLKKKYKNKKQKDKKQ